MHITCILYVRISVLSHTPPHTPIDETHVCIRDAGSPESQDFVQDKVGQEQLETGLGLYLTEAAGNTTTKETDVGRLEQT